MYKKYTQGVTLIELLTTMSIIFIIAVLFLAVGGPARETAKRKKAKVMISALEMAIGMYKADTGSYPPTDDGLNSINLYDALTNLNHGVKGNPAYIAGWAGPYMQFKNVDLGSATVTTGGYGYGYGYGATTMPVIIDPWRRSFQYRMPGTPSTNNNFELWSNGSDPSSTADDITNW